MVQLRSSIYVTKWFINVINCRNVFKSCTTNFKAHIKTLMMNGNGNNNNMNTVETHLMFLGYDVVLLFENHILIHVLLELRVIQENIVH